MTARPRVLVVTNRIPGEAKPYAGWYVKAHAELHRAAGMDVMVIGPDMSPSLSAARYLAMLWRLGRAVAGFKFDLVHAHWVLPSGLLGLVVARIQRIPLVLTSHGAFVMGLEERRWPLRWLVRWVLDSADAVIAVGHDHGRRIAGLLGEGSGEIPVIPMGVVIPDELPERDACRKRYGLAQGTFSIGFIGNLEGRKGGTTLVAACDRLSRSGIRFELRVAGQGVQEAYLRSLIRSVGLDDQTIFVGPLPHTEVGLFYRAFDVVAVPSLNEPFGLVAVEAMAYGAAVVASDVGGLAETIDDGQTGLLFAAGDADDLAACLERICRDPELRGRLAAAGMVAARRYEIRRMADEILTVYRRVLPTRLGASKGAANPP